MLHVILQSVQALPHPYRIAQRGVGDAGMQGGREAGRHMEALKSRVDEWREGKMR
jgi:hypothetical protein